MTNLTNKEAQVLAALRAAAETTYETNGEQWGSVYLDNAGVEGMSAKSFDGVLGSLTTKGLYEAESDGIFGSVRLDGDEATNEEVAVDNFASLYNACRDGNAMTRCAALRVTAQNWTSTRKDFMDQAERYGINSHTAATQWQAGRKA